MKILIGTLGHTRDDDRVYHKMIVSLIAAGHEVHLVTRNDPRNPPEHPNLLHTDFGQVGITAYSRRLEQLAAEWPPDLVQVHEYHLLPAAIKIKERLGIPLVYDVQDPNLEMWATVSRKPPPIKQIYNYAQGRYERHYLKQVDKVIGLSQLITERYTSWGADVVWIPNYPRLRPVESASNREPVVLYHGQLTKERGIERLVHAFRQVSDAAPLARLDMYGWEQRSGFCKRLELLATQEQIEDKVHIYPPLPYLDLMDHLSTVQIGVIPFDDQPLSRIAPLNKLYEYFLGRCAVVASDLPILREEGGEAVKFVPPGDTDALAEAIIHLLQNNQERTRLALSGRQLFDTIFNWERVEPDFLAVYSSLA